MPVDRGRLTSSLSTRRSSNSSNSSRTSSSVSFAGGISHESVANLDSFMRECRSAYLSVLSSTTEDITSIEELELALQFSGRSPSKKILQKFWKEDTVSMKYNDFCDVAKKIKPTSKDDLLKAFKKMDVNNDGYITHEELYRVLTMKGERMTKSEVRALLDRADDNGDGKLDYDEFCSMIVSTAKDCKKANEKKMTDHEDTAQETSERRPSLKKGSLMASLSRSSKEEEKTKKATITEPKGYKRWACDKKKGCFCHSEDGKILSHQYTLKVRVKTAVWLMIQPTKDTEDGDIDMTMFVTQHNKGEVLAFTENKIKRAMCCDAVLDAGTYDIVVFTTGCKLIQKKSSPRSEAKLVKGHGDDLTLTKECRQAFTEIFNQCDLNDDGLLDRKEFDIFQTRTSGEVCDDDSWEVLHEHFEMKDNQITLQGFLDLNLMEAKDSEGDPADLWVTLETMGYNRALEQDKAFPFEITAYAKSGQCELEANLELTDGGEVLQQAVLTTAFNHSTIESIKGMKDLFLHRYQSDTRITLLVENKSHTRVMLRIDCSQSKNCLSHRGSLNYCIQVNPNTLEVGHHLVPADDEKEWMVKTMEYIQ